MKRVSRPVGNIQRASLLSYPYAIATELPSLLTVIVFCPTMTVVAEGGSRIDAVSFRDEMNSEYFAERNADLDKYRIKKET